MSESHGSPEKPRKKLGCWFTPLLFAIALIAAGTWMMDSWSTLPGPGKALAVILVGFGALLLLPVILYVIFKIWMGRLQRTLEESLGGLKDAMGQIAADTKQIYEAPQEYRPAAPDDFADVDRAFYDQTESRFRDAGYRTLGDLVIASIEELGKPSPPLRVMLSSGGTNVGACYHLSSGDHDYRVAEITTAFSDGTWLVTANTAGADLTTAPPQIERRQLEQGASVAQLIEAHAQEQARLIAAKEGRACLAMQTLDEVQDMNKRLHEVKRAFFAAQAYVDAPAVQRIIEAQARASDEAP